MDAAVALIIFLASHNPTLGGAPTWMAVSTTYFSNMDLCEASKRSIEAQTKQEDMKILVSCHHLTGAAPRAR